LASASKLNEEMAMVNARNVSAFFDTSDRTLLKQDIKDYLVLCISVPTLQRITLCKN